MPIGSSDLRAVGDRLLSNADEASLRSACSRHYYAAYHDALAWLASRPGMHSIGGPAGGAHQQVLNGLRAIDPSHSIAAKQQGRKLAAVLQVMRDRRRVADYELAATITVGEASIQGASAAKFAADCATPLP